MTNEAKLKLKVARLEKLFDHVTAHDENTFTIILEPIERVVTLTDDFVLIIKNEEETFSCQI